MGSGRRIPSTRERKDEEDEEEEKNYGKIVGENHLLLRLNQPTNDTKQIRTEAGRRRRRKTQFGRSGNSNGEKKRKEKINNIYDFVYAFHRRRGSCVKIVISQCDCQQQTY